jgi:hypothetical protein
MYKPNISRWEGILCEIRGEIKAQCNESLDYAKDLCDKLEAEMVNYSRLKDTEFYYIPQVGSKEELTGPEWHYVKDGYFPPEGKRVLVFWSNTYNHGTMWERGNVSIGYYNKEWDEDFEDENFWLDDNDEDVLHEVLCWKEIGDLPKEAFAYPATVTWDMSESWDEKHKWYAYHDLGEHIWKFDCSEDGSYPRCCVSGWFHTMDDAKGYIRNHPQG